MPKIKMPKSSPALDMTPMVDLAFLLVTFFMLTAQFRPEESVVVDTPSSQSVLDVPKDNIMFITIDSTGRVFWDFKEANDRVFDIRGNILQTLSAKYNVGFTEEQMDKFRKLSGMGVPFEKLPDFLDLKTGDQRKAFHDQNDGIPFDSTNNQLKEWVMVTQQTYYDATQVKPEVVLKADGNVNYDIVNKVIKIFQSDEIQINRFKMVTDLEK